MSLLDVRNAIVGEIHGHLPSLRTCEGHGGRFDARELQRWAKKAPAVLVACLGFNGLSRNRTATMQFAAFVLVGSKPREPRDEAVLLLVSAVANLLDGNTWGLEMVESAPEQIRANNLYSAIVDKRGMALWGITWRQNVNLSNFDPSTLDDFLTCHITSDLKSGEEGEPLAKDLVQLEGASNG